MAKDGMGKRLAEARNAQFPRVSQGAAAQYLGVNRSTYANWEAGISQPPAGIAERLAAWWGIPVTWFFTDKPLPGHSAATVTKLDSPPKPLQSLARGDYAVVPVWRGIAAGLEDECHFIPSDSTEFMEVPAFMVEGILDNCAVGIVTGSSMAPRISHGERLIMKFEPTPPVGSIVVAKNGDNAHFVKVLRDDGGRLYLESLNNKFAPIERLKGWTLVGSVVGVWGDADRGRNIEWNAGRPLRG